MTITSLKPLVESDWLAAQLDQPNLRVLECTVFLRRDESGRSRAESGRAEWEQGHIPGSAFADLIHDLSDPRNTRYSFPFPPAEQFAAAMSRLGVGDDSAVVLYDRNQNLWAARLWWMLRAYGFDRAGVLNGGWAKWTGEGRPVSTAAPDYPPAQFTPRPRPELIAGKDEVLAAIDAPDHLLINALRPEEHAARRIPSSVNVPSVGESAIVDPATMTYLPLDELRRRFEASGANGKERVITYCGGGIAASSAALALHLIGVPNVAVYDGSLSEWTSDPALPLEKD